MWMKHKDHEGIADLPDLPYWRAQGWEPADGPPPEPDLLHDPEPEEEQAAEVPEVPEESSGTSSFTGSTDIEEN